MISTLPHPFPHILPCPTGTNATDRTYSAFLFSDFVKEKKKEMTFLFV
jgi:hypothetical protein